MKKVIRGMGKIEFGRFYNPNNRIINSVEETPILESTLTKEISWKQLRNFLDNNYIYSLLTHRKNINVYKTKAINLLSKYRFDIFVKYYYVRCYIENHNLKEATDIYLSHIKAFNNFREPDGRKNGADIFLQNFNNLIENIRVCNNLDKTIIPISMTGIPIDGAHRIAISLYLGIEVNYCVFDLLDGKYDEDFFKQRGMPSEYIYKINQLFFFEVERRRMTKATRLALEGKNVILDRCALSTVAISYAFERLGKYRTFGHAIGEYEKLLHNPTLLTPDEYIFLYTDEDNIIQRNKTRTKELSKHWVNSTFTDYQNEFYETVSRKIPHSQRISTTGKAKDYVSSIIAQILNVHEIDSQEL